MGSALGLSMIPGRTWHPGAVVLSSEDRHGFRGVTSDSRHSSFSLKELGP